MSEPKRPAILLTLVLGVAAAAGEPACCPGGETPEAEPCGADTNGGCNSTPSSFEPIECGEPVCGTVWASNDERDTDWFEVTTGPARIFATLRAGFDSSVVLLDPDVAPGGECAAADVLSDWGCAIGCGPETVSAIVTGGTCVVFVSLGCEGIFDGFPCDGGGVEYQLLIECTTCLADIDGSGDVGVDDLVAVILDWGCDQPFTCSSDVTADGRVGVEDLIAVIQAWGSCP